MGRSWETQGGTRGRLPIEGWVECPPFDRVRGRSEGPRPTRPRVCPPFGSGAGEGTRLPAWNPSTVDLLGVGRVEPGVVVDSWTGWGRGGETCLHDTKRVGSGRSTRVDGRTRWRKERRGTWKAKRSRGGSQEETLRMKEKIEVAVRRPWDKTTSTASFDDPTSPPPYHKSKDGSN